MSSSGLPRQMPDDPRVLELLQKQWKAGVMSLRVLSIKFNVDATALTAFAMRSGWGDRGSLHAQIDEGATRAMMNRAVSTQDSVDAFGSDSQKVARLEPKVMNDEDLTEQYSQIVATVVESQRRGVNRGRLLTERLMSELEELQPVKIDSNAVEGLAAAIKDTNPELAKMLTAPSDNEAKERMNFTRSRIGMLRTLSESHARYIALERQAWGLDAQKSVTPNSFDDIVDMARGI